MCPNDFSTNLKKKPTAIQIIEDNYTYNKLSIFTKKSNFWKGRFLSTLNSGKYTIALSTKRLIEKNIDQLFPNVLLLVGKKNPNLFSKVSLINFAGDIFKSNFLFDLLWRHYSGKIFGAQHGGGYKINHSRMFTCEIECYKIFFMRKLKKIQHAKIPKKRVELIGAPGIILVASMPFDKMEAFGRTKDLNNIKRIMKKRSELRHILKDLQIPVYIREHPKSTIPSFSNTEYFEPNHPKPVIWARRNDLIILEAPGTTTEIECIKYGLNYLCIFDPLDFKLTKAGISHYNDIKCKNMLASLQEAILTINEQFCA